MPKYIGYNFTGTANSTVVTPSYYEKVELLLKGEGSDASTTFIDDSIRNRSVDSLVGAVQIDTAQFKFGSSSILFDGTDDFIRYGGSTGFEFTGVFTIDTWFRTGTSGTNLSIIGTSNESAWTSDGYYVFVNNDTFSLYRNGSLNDTFVAGATIADSTWHHWHMTRHANNAVEMGLDGTSLGFSTTAETGNFGNASFRLAIGSAEPTGTTQPEWNGHMDHFRITKGTTLFNGTYTVPTESDYNYIFDKKYNSGVWSIGGPGKYSVIGRRKQGNWLTSARGITDEHFANVSLLLHFDGADASTTFTDSSSNGHTVSVQGNAQLDDAEFKFGTTSGLFDGSGDYAEVNDADFNLSSGDWTIEGWFYDAGDTSRAPYFSITAGGGGGLTLLLQRQIGPGRSELFLSSDNSTWDICQNRSIGTPTLNQWNHIAITFDGSAYRTFVNGSLITTVSSTTSIYNNQNLMIGTRHLEDQFFDGWIDEFRVTKGVARYTASFTAPTAAFLNY